MSIVIVVIVVIVIIYWLFSSSVDSHMDDMGLNEEEKESAWWTLGMFIDMQNKKNKK